MGSPNIEAGKSREVLAKNMRELLREAELKEAQLAERTNVSQKQVNNITNARTGCGIDALDQIAKALHVEPWMLLVPRFHDPEVARKLRETVKEMLR